MFKKPLCTIPPGSGGDQAPHAPLIPGMGSHIAPMWIEDSRRRVQEVPDKAKVEPSSRRADVDMELCSSQRDDRLDLIETLGQRQCSAPGSGKSVPGSVEVSGSIGDDWNAPGAHRDGRMWDRPRRTETNVPVPSRSAASINCFPYATPTMAWCSISRPIWVRQRGSVPVRPARLPGARIVCSEFAVGAARYNA